MVYALFCFLDYTGDNLGKTGPKGKGYALCGVYDNLPAQHIGVVFTCGFSGRSGGPKGITGSTPATS